MKKLAVALLVAAVPFAANAQEKEKPDFLFSEDNKIVHSEGNPSETLQPKKLIDGDTWLNAPMSRLDYVLVRIQAKLENSIPPAVKEYAPSYFDRAKGYGNYTESPSTTIDVRYYADKGRLLITAGISDLGKPKKPMKDLCELIARVVETSFPFNQLGYLWPNYALGPLMRDSSSRPEYQHAVEALAGSMVITVSLNSIYQVGEKRNFYQITCHKQGDKEPLEFRRYSSSRQAP